MNQTDTKIFSAHISLVLADKVDLLAARLHRSREWVIEQALTTWADQEEQHSRMTREGMADMDAGRIFDHQTVRGWVDSLETDTPIPPPL